MRAFLLAAGLGTRLRPITDELPKCLIPIHGKPLLIHWLDLLEKEDVSDVLVNTHHLADKVEEAVSRRRWNLRIKLSREPRLLGSAGTILKNLTFIEDEQNFFILYADNLTDVSLKPLRDLHSSVDSLFTTYVYETDIPRQKGIFVVDESTGKVLDFEEKPINPKSNLANAGIGIASREILKYLPDKIPSDLGFDVMPSIVSRMYAVKALGYIRDIGTKADYEEAQHEWMLRMRDR
jgi:mannose-1-phosphate guanylyltransferase